MCWRNCLVFVQVKDPTQPAVRISNQQEREITGVCWCPSQPHQVATCAEDYSVCVWNAGPHQTRFAQDELNTEPVLWQSTLSASAAHNLADEQHDTNTAPAQPSLAVLAAGESAPASAQPLSPLQLQPPAPQSPLQRVQHADSLRTPLARTPQHANTRAGASALADPQSGWHLNLSPDRRPHRRSATLQQEHSMAALADVTHDAPSQYGLASQAGITASPGRSVDTHTRATRCGAIVLHSLATSSQICI